MKFAYRSYTCELLVIFVNNFCVFLREKRQIGRCKRPQHVIVESTKIKKIFLSATSTHLIKTKISAPSICRGNNSRDGAQVLLGHHQNLSGLIDVLFGKHCVQDLQQRYLQEDTSVKNLFLIVRYHKLTRLKQAHHIIYNSGELVLNCERAHALTSADKLGHSPTARSS